MRNSLPVDEPRSIQDENDEASEKYPAVVLATGQRLHVYEHGGEWCVRLNTEVSDHDGICVAVESSRDSAIAQAVRVFEAAVEQLQQPPW